MNISVNSHMLYVKYVTTHISMNSLREKIDNTKSVSQTRLIRHCEFITMQ